MKSILSRRKSVKERIWNCRMRGKSTAGTIPASGQAFGTLPEIVGIHPSGTDEFILVLGSRIGSLQVNSPITGPAHSTLALRTYAPGKTITINAAISSGTGDILLQSARPVIRTAVGTVTTGSPGQLRT